MKCKDKIASIGGFTSIYKKVTWCTNVELGHLILVMVK